MGEDTEVHSSQVLNHLGHLVKTIIGTSPVQDPHPEQAKENWIVDASPINLSKPFHPSDHIGPEMIIEEEVRVYVPPPAVMNDGFIVWLPWLPNAVEGILGNLQALSVFYQKEQRGNLPHTSMGNVQNPMLGYEPFHPIDE